MNRLLSCSATAAALCLSLFAGSAAAQSVAPAAAERPEHAGWYGWQTIIGFGVSDAFGVAALVASGSGGDPHNSVAALAIPGALGHVFAGPIVHWSHGHVRRGFASLGLTLGSAAVTSGLGAALGYAGNTCERSPSGLGNTSCVSLEAIGAAVGLALGTVIGNVIDVATLSRDQPSTMGFELTPMISWDRVGLGVTGRF
jgi:hypothetical protein